MNILPPNLDDTRLLIIVANERQYKACQTTPPLFEKSWFFILHKDR